MAEQNTKDLFDVFNNMSGGVIETSKNSKSEGDWQEFSGNENSDTPINAANLNIMLDLTRSIKELLVGGDRKGITEFSTNLQGEDLVINNPNTVGAANAITTLATYLKEAFNRIQGTNAEEGNTDWPSLQELKNRIGSLSDINIEGITDIVEAINKLVSEKLDKNGWESNDEDGWHYNWQENNNNKTDINKDYIEYKKSGTQSSGSTIGCDQTTLDSSGLSVYNESGDPHSNAAANTHYGTDKITHTVSYPSTDDTKYVLRLPHIEGEQTLAVKSEVDTEISRAQAAESALITKINTEITDRQDAINSLNFTNKTVSASETLSAISQTDGKINVGIQKIQIQPSQVTGLAASVQTIKVNNATNADVADKANKDGSGKVISDTYATKSDISNIKPLDSNVKMSENLRITEKFGRYVPDSTTGYVDIPCKDKTLRQFLLDALQVSSVGSITMPSFNYSSGATIYEEEVGTRYEAPTCTFTVTGVGSYQYGPATGITFDGTLTSTDVSAVSFSGLTKNKTASITANAGGVYDTTEKSISFTGNYSYTAGVAPYTNLNEEDESYKIQAGKGTLSHTCTYRGYYKMFMGVGDANTLDSAAIRNLSIKKKESKSTETITASVGDKSIIWAIRKDFTSNAPTFKYYLFGNYESLENVVGPVPVGVKDGGGSADVIYNVYTYTPAATEFTAEMKTQITIN